MKRDRSHCSKLRVWCFLLAAGICCLLIVVLRPEPPTSEDNADNRREIAGDVEPKSPERHGIRSSLLDGATDAYFIPSPFGSLPMILAVVPLVGLSGQELSRFSLAVAGWVEHLLVPQRNMHLALLVSAHHSPKQVADQIGLDVLNSSHFTLPSPNRFPITIFRMVSHENTTAIDRQPKKENSANDGSCCACSTSQLQEQAAAERWMSIDLFDHPLVSRYTFVLRMNIDTWIFRRPRFTLTSEMISHGAYLAHIGPLANDAPPCRSAGVTQLAELVAPHSRLANYANFDSGFLIVRVDRLARGSKARMVIEKLLGSDSGKFEEKGWRASSLWSLALVQAHLGSANGEVMNTAQVRDLQWMLWQVKAMRRNAVLYHATSAKTINEIKQWTRLRWSRVVREPTNF